MSRAARPGPGIPKRVSARRARTAHRLDESIEVTFCDEACLSDGCAASRLRFRATEEEAVSERSVTEKTPGPPSRQSLSREPEGVAHGRAEEDACQFLRPVHRHVAPPMMNGRTAPGVAAVSLGQP